MMMLRRPVLATLLLVVLAATAHGAGEAGDADPRQTIAGMLPGVTADDVRETPLDGLYEVAFGSQVFYVTADRRYLFKGDIVDMSSNESLTEARRDELRLAAVEKLDQQEMIVFGPEHPKHTVTVFTDVDCTFCRKFHSEIGDLNDRGIQVRYLFYPRFGPGSDGWKKAEAVWCSDDRQDALTRAKRGEEIKAGDCGATPVAAQYELGNRMGVRGTPALLMEDGELVPGYVPAKQLADYLDGQNAE